MTQRVNFVLDVDIRTFFILPSGLLNAVEESGWLSITLIRNPLLPPLVT